jgi:hypothetical protein
MGEVATEVVKVNCCRGMEYTALPLVRIWCALLGGSMGTERTGRGGGLGEGGRGA